MNFKVYDGCFHAFDIICAGSGIAKEAVDFLMTGFKYAVENYFAEQVPEQAEAESDRS